MSDTFLPYRRQSIVPYDATGIPSTTEFRFLTIGWHGISVNNAYIIKGTATIRNTDVM